MNLKVIRYTDDKKADITQLVTSISWGGDITTAYRTLDISLVNTSDGSTPYVDITNGHVIRVYSGDEELFRGIIFKVTMSNDGDQLITVFDYNVYLTKNKDSIRFNKLKASDIIKRICKKFGIKTGTIHDTGYVIPKMIFRSETLYDMITIALTETEKKNGRTFALINSKGKLELRERKTQLRKLIIDDDRNMISSSYTASIEDRKTSVKIESDDGKTSVTERDNKSETAFGKMQELETIEEGSTKTEAKKLAKEILKRMNKTDEEFNVEALGRSDITAGTAVVVNDSMTNVNGAFYVITDTHNINADGFHTMSLKLSKTLDIDRKDYVPPEEPKKKETTKKTASKSSSSSSTSGFIKPATGRLSSGFGARGGRRHNGVDIAQGGTVAIKAAMDGKVSRSYRSASYGECVMITHTYKGATYETVYAHMRGGSRRVKVGQAVKQGQTIGYMGNTGHSTGQHLHFEIHKGRWNSSKSNAVNPANYIKI